MKTKFKNAREAFVYFYNEINLNGVNFGNTKALFNVGFTLENPSQKNINVLNPDRKFNLEYADRFLLYGKRCKIQMEMLDLIMVGNGNASTN